MSDHRPNYESDQPPRYQADFSHLHSLWQKAIEAASAADELASRLVSARKDLATSSKLLKQLKERSSASFQLLHKRRRASARFLPARTLFITRKQTSSLIYTTEAERSAAQADFKRARELENGQAQHVADLTSSISQMLVMKEPFDSLAMTAEDLWVALTSTDEAHKEIPGIHLAVVNSAHEDAERTDSDFREVSTVCADLSRAQLAASNSHRYLMNVLLFCDELDTGGTARAVSSGFKVGVVNVKRQHDYIQALTEGKKAQACLNEAFRVLERHREMIPITLIGDYEDLKDSGALQISPIYDLLYRGKTSPSTIRPLVQLMLDRQESAFSKLTNVAVWIQDTVPRCELEEKQARRQRDAARFRLAQLWKEMATGLGATLPPLDF